jgi:hypothetical protein
MTHPKTEDLLKKINYIEADVEIHKQILFSIPSAQKADMEKTITLIAAKKEEIEVLRQQLLKYDPEEYDRIVIFENAVSEFRKIAASNPFQSIVNRNVHEECVLAMHNGEKRECLIKACDKQGNWTIITLDGKIEQFPSSDVAETLPEKNNF